jgi:hypothetical protein
MPFVPVPDTVTVRVVLLGSFSELDLHMASTEEETLGERYPPPV